MILCLTFESLVLILYGSCHNIRVNGIHGRIVTNPELHILLPFSEKVVYFRDNN